MKFLLDAQLPERLRRQLQQAGHDAVHTLDLPKGNRTPNVEIIERARQDGRVVITKDADFVNSFTIARRRSQAKDLRRPCKGDGTWVEAAQGRLPFCGAGSRL